MNLVTKRDMIRSVLERHREQYPNPNFKFADGTLAGDADRRLAALNLETCSEDDVEEVIGNRSWTQISCDCCEADVAIVVSLNVGSLCPACIGKAAKLINSPRARAAEKEGA